MRTAYQVAASLKGDGVEVETGAIHGLSQQHHPRGPGVI